MQDESIDKDKEWFEIWMLNCIIIIIIEMVKIIIYLDKEINIIIINS